MESGTFFNPKNLVRKTLLRIGNVQRPSDDFSVCQRQQKIEPCVATHTNAALLIVRVLRLLAAQTLRILGPNLYQYDHATVLVPFLS